ncbi:MAG: NAD(P)(+) transhydrogenase (Re/Si-specific) subunit alpha [Granulosicoccus sp.]|nr:NAD(P)(+) transhydrogenase (Re/Si-specific) subunit alpha [Granulosicoccus sp.]
MALKLALPRESIEIEKRVALDPTTVARLIDQHNIDVCIESHCGDGAGFYDDDYENAQVAKSFKDCVNNAILVVKVKPPTVEEAHHLPIGCVLLSQITPYLHLDVIDVLRSRQITTFALDHMPRITRAQPMDILSSQATVAGYKAALLAAELSPRLFPMLTTAAGTIRPSRVIVIGAGVAGLQAIATARRLGARVEAYDIRSAAREQIESLGATMIDTGVTAEGARGRARALNREEKQTQHDVLADRMSQAHAVICAAAIPGRRAPRIITVDMIEGMMPDTVIVDMAAETGGNCELTRAGESYMHGDTLIVGPLNLPSSGAVHASEMFSRNVYNMLKLMLDERGQLHLDWGDEILSACLLTHNGNIHHQATADLMEIECAPPITEQRERSEEQPDQAAGWLEDGADPEQEDSLAETVVEQVDESLSETGDSAFDDDEERDDLMAIDGIGPALQNRLYAFHIRTFKKLASLDELEIEQLERQLDDNEGLSVSDWVRQAQELEKPL